MENFWYNRNNSIEIVNIITYYDEYVHLVFLSFVSLVWFTFEYVVLHLNSHYYSLFNFNIESHGRSILEVFYFHLQNTLAFSFFLWKFTIKCLTFGINDVKFLFLLILCRSFRRTQTDFIVRTADISLLHVSYH